MSRRTRVSTLGAPDRPWSMASHEHVLTDADTDQIHPTRKFTFHTMWFLHDDVLIKIGIQDENHRMLEKVSFGSFSTKSGNLHRKPATEFLARVMFHYPKVTSNASKGWINFFIDDEHHKLSSHQLDAIYGFPRRSEREAGTITEPQEFWATISSGTYASGPWKQTHIHNHVFRMVAKFVCSMIFDMQ